MVKEETAVVQQALAAVARDGSFDLNELIGSLLPPVDSAKRQAIRDSLSSGEEVSPKAVTLILVNGSTEERTAIRSACTTPRAIARNQDRLIPKLIHALRGDSKARQVYENSRIIIPEILPDWATKIWEKEATAPWRTLDLHGEKLDTFIRKVRCAPEEQFHTVVITPFDPKATEQLKGNIKFRDEREAFLTYGPFRKFINLVGQDAHRTTPRQNLIAFADQEIRHGLRILISPTPIGQHYRECCEREIKILFSAQLVEDVCLALNFPLGDVAKGKLLKQIVDSPWLLIAQLKLHRVQEQVAVLRAEGAQEADIATHVEQFLFESGAMTRFIESRRPKPTPAVVTQNVTAEETPWPPEAVVQERRTAITKALEASPFKASFDVKRQTRRLMPLVNDSEVLFKRAIDLLKKRGEPNGIVAELESTRASSFFKPDERPKVDATDVPQNTEASATPTVPSHSNQHSKRLFLKAIIESHYPPDIDVARTARVLDKLTSGSEKLFERALEALEQEVDIDALIGELRSARAPASTSPKETAAPAVMPRELMQALNIGIDEPEKTPMHFRFTRAADKVMTDGTIRHATMLALEHFAEKPEIADTRKISAPGGHNVWELRLLRENLRVYFQREEENRIKIVFIGKKDEQDTDIRDRIPQILANEA